MEGAPRVAVVCRPLVEIEAIALLLVTVEFWADSTVLRVAAIPNATTARLTAEHRRDLDAWAADRRRGEPETSPPPEDPGYRRMRRLGPTLHDDAGTRYVLVTAGMGGSGTEWRGEWVFRPGAPPAARILHVNATDGVSDYTMPVDIPAR